MKTPGQLLTCACGRVAVVTTNSDYYLVLVVTNIIPYLVGLHVVGRCLAGFRGTFGRGRHHAAAAAQQLCTTLATVWSGAWSALR